MPVIKFNENMNLTLSFFFVGSFVYLSFAPNQTSLGLRAVDAVDNTTQNVSTGGVISDNGDDKDDYTTEDSDFEDNDSEDFINLLDSKERGVYSVTHLHQEQGEILVPCFGMWWPVGGPAYDYVGDYYGDYKRKRKRSRKQKKAARMRKRKS